MTIRDGRVFVGFFWEWESQCFCSFCCWKSFCGAIAIYLAPLETDIRLFSFVVCCGTGLSCVSEDARSGSMVYSEWSDRDRGGSIAPLRGPWSRDPTVECRDKEPEDRYERWCSDSDRYSGRTIDDQCRQIRNSGGVCELSGGIDWCRLQARGVIHRLEGLLNRYLFLGLSSKYLAEPFFCFIFAVTKAEYSHRINDISRDGAVGSSSGS